MATLPELAEHGIVGSADVLPMPVGSTPRTLDVVEDELTGVSLSLYEEELLTERLRLALASAQRGRRELRETVRHMCNELNGFDCPPPGETPLQLVTRVSIAWSETEARVAALLEERRSTNEALDDAVQALRARQSCPCPPADQPGPHQLGCPQAEVPVSAPSERPVNELTATFMPVPSLRASLEDPHDGPLAHRYLVPRDLPEGCHLSEEQVRELGNPFLDGGAR